MKKFYTIVFLLAAMNVNAQFPPVTVPGSEVRTIISSVIPGQVYELQILLPGGYKNSNKKYPVVYLMDSQWDFPLVKSIYGQQYYDGFIPELILVGITWGGSNRMLIV
jgi:predicted alpha/beta superfamily hydrolase